MTLRLGRLILWTTQENYWVCGCVNRPATFVIPSTTHSQPSSSQVSSSFYNTVALADFFSFFSQTRSWHCSLPLMESDWQGCHPNQVIAERDIPQLVHLGIMF